MNPAGRAIDAALDWTVVPGYASLGFRLRRPLWDNGPGAASLAGRDVVVTGASSGIGEAACVLLARAGARVHMVVRDPERGRRARDRVRARAATGGRGGPAIEVHRCDIADLDSVRELAQLLGSAAPALAGLVHNAGVLTAERQRSPQGHELTFTTAVLGPFLLTNLLLAGLRRGEPSRVVWVSSGGMYTARLQPDDLELDRRAFDGARFYAHAKRAQVVLAGLFAERHRAEGVGFASMHPGWADTPGLASSLPRFRRLFGPLLRTPEQGADTAVWLLSSPEADRRPGAFWHDRRARSPHRVPWTRESAADRERLWVELCASTDWNDQARTGGP